MPTIVPLTIRDIIDYRDKIFVWLQEVDARDSGQSEKLLEEMSGILDRLDDSVKINNCDPFGRLEVSELKPETVTQLVELCRWAEERLSEQVKKYKKSLH